METEILLVASKWLKEGKRGRRGVGGEERGRGGREKARRGEKKEGTHPAVSLSVCALRSIVHVSSFRAHGCARVLKATRIFISRRHVMPRAFPSVAYYLRTRYLSACLSSSIALSNVTVPVEGEQGEEEEEDRWRRTIARKRKNMLPLSRNPPSDRPERWILHGLVHERCWMISCRVYDVLLSRRALIFPRVENELFPVLISLNFYRIGNETTLAGTVRKQSRLNSQDLRQINSLVVKY